MGRIVHIALKCRDKDSFEQSSKFYEDVFGITRRRPTTPVVIPHVI